MAQSNGGDAISSRREAINKILRDLADQRAKLKQQEAAVAEALDRNKTDFTLNQGALAMLDDLFPPPNDGDGGGNGQAPIPPPPEEYVEVVRGTGV